MSRSGAILLAGGLSSRMGHDKAGLFLDGQTLLERLIRTVTPLVSQTIVMLAPTQDVPQLSVDLFARIEIGRDSSPAQGPLQGIADAMTLLKPDVGNLFVLSCDLPFLTTKSLEWMRCFLTPDIDGVCAEGTRKVNPLLAVYQRRLVAESVVPVAAGRSCMVLVDGHRIIRLPAPADNPMLFSDINTPDAYELAKTLLKKST